MEDFELVGPNGTDINNEFLKQYRDSLKNQFDANVSSLKQQKRNSDASIMSNANRAGLMYSNFPQRSKIQTEADYLTDYSKLRKTYQTGLDSLRNNAVDAYNKIKAYEEAISDLNAKASGTTGTNKTTPGSNPDSNPGNTSGGITGEIPTIQYNENVPQYSDAGWSNTNWDRQVAESNGKYTDYVFLPDWLERGWQTGEWFFGNQKGKG